MARILTGAFAALTLATGAGMGAGAGDLSMVTGASGGTYIQFGRDIARVAGGAGLSVDVRESAGSLENVYAVRYTPGVQMGIVQSDVMGYLSAREGGAVPVDLSPEDFEKLSDLIGSLRYLAPLYIEEVHLLAHAGIGSLADLDGRIVSVGRNGGGSFITAEQLFRQAEIDVEVVFDIPESEALDLLRQGVIDAMVYVVGQPAGLFADQIAPTDGLRLLPIELPALLNRYETATIEPSSYSWLDAPVPTVGVRSLLVSYDYAGEETCERLGRLTGALGEGLAELRASGHEKWSTVALDAEVVGGWEPYRCAETAAAETIVDPVAAPAPGGGSGSLLQQLQQGLQ